MKTGLTLLTLYFGLVSALCTITLPIAVTDLPEGQGPQSPQGSVAPEDGTNAAIPRSAPNQTENSDQTTASESTSTAVLGSVIVVVSGNLGWQGSGIYVDRGSEINVSYVDGLWAARVGFGPELPDIWADGNGTEFLIDYPELGLEARFASLIARIENGTPILIGNSRIFDAELDGQLFFRMHDVDMTDNDGEIVIQVRVEP